jgi:hypothetical protein
LPGEHDNGHILIVDDQREICDLVRVPVWRGYRVSTAMMAPPCDSDAQDPVDLAFST